MTFWGISQKITIVVSQKSKKSDIFGGKKKTKKKQNANSSFAKIPKM